jgi:ribokinase
MVDLVTYVERLPHAGETVFARGFAQGHGGKGANQAAAAALHGVATALVACVGDDLFGPATVADLDDFGVDTTHVRVVPGQATGTAAIFVEPSGENRIALAAGANAHLDGTPARAALEALGRRPGGPPAVVVAKLETPQEAAASAFAWGRELGAATVLNPGPAAALSSTVLAACDWLAPNESELAVLLGLAPDHPVEDLLPRAPALADDLGVGLVVTLGAAGAAVLLDGALVPVPAPPVVATDTTGAGDAFVGGFATALAHGLGPLAAARLAVAFASDSVTRPGTRRSYRRLAALADPARAT